MSLLIYTKTASDKTCIPDVNSGLVGQIDFGAWTELRLGLFFSGVSSTNDNAAAVVETVTISSVLDRITIGLKDSSNLTIPGQAGSLFLGVLSDPTGGASSYCGGSYYATGGSGRLNAGGYVGTTLIGGTTGYANTGMQFPADPSPATGYGAFYGIKFVIANRGTASQTVTFSSARTSPVSGSDYSASALRAALLGGSYTAMGSISWNDGVAAYDIPDSFWVRLPFQNNRIRISCIDVVKIAPV